MKTKEKAERMLGGWREQYDRMLRSHTRLERIANGGQEASSDEARDALFHFFQDAYHLKDWLKNDDSVEAEDPETAINDNASLQLSADLCNRVKHLKLRSSRSGDLSTGIGSQSVTVRVGTLVSGRSSPERAARPSLHGWTVRSGAKEVDALGIAGAAVSAWNAMARQAWSTWLTADLALMRGDTRFVYRLAETLACCHLAERLPGLGVFDGPDPASKEERDG